MTARADKELKLIDKISSEFAKKELRQIVEKSGSEYFSPYYNSLLEKARTLGFFYIILPEKTGGSGLDCRALCSVLKNICMEDCSFGAIMFTTIAACEILYQAKKESLLNDFIENKKKAKQFLISFPIFSNPLENKIKLVAKQITSGYLLSGSLDYLVLAGVAKKALVPAIIPEKAGFSYFLIDLTEIGVSVSEPVRGLGITACHVSDLQLKQVPGIICCQPDEGNRLFNHLLSKLSPGLAAMETGLMAGSFKEALNYAKKRMQGGRKIIDWSEIKKILSGMAMNLQLAEMLVKQSCASVLNNTKGWEADTAAASAKISEMACELTSDGIRLMCGGGYMKDFNQEKRFRDARHLMSVFGIMQMKRLVFLEKYITKSAGYTIQERLGNDIFQQHRTGYDHKLQCRDL